MLLKKCMQMMCQNSTRLVHFRLIILTFKGKFVTLMQVKNVEALVHYKKTLHNMNYVVFFYITNPRRSIFCLCSVPVVII